MTVAQTKWRLGSARWKFIPRVVGMPSRGGVVIAARYYTAALTPRNAACYLRMMPDTALLRTERLTRAFGSLMAVDRVDVAVRKGELRSIIGPNGAGKTTFFRLISGEMPPTSGRILFNERDITGLPQHTVVRLGIAKSYQITNVFPHLTVHENVRVAVQGYTRCFNFWTRADRLDDVRDRATALLHTIGLGAKADLLAAHLSHGEKRHLEIGIALASEPALLLLDEPTAGMSPEETDETMTLIRELAAGRTIILVEHKMKVVMKISDRITVLHQGQVLAEGTPEEIRANDRVQQTYLGASR
jgi:branched-chain amino acid transport system ATP-binding protein